MINIIKQNVGKIIIILLILIIIGEWYYNKENFSGDISNIPVIGIIFKPFAAAGQISYWSSIACCIIIILAILGAIIGLIKSFF